MSADRTEKVDDRRAAFAAAVKAAVAGASIELRPMNRHGITIESRVEIRLNEDAGPLVFPPLDDDWRDHVILLKGGRP